MKIDSTITISVVIAVCAIISPVFTTLLNNHHIYKMKKLDENAALRKSSYLYKQGIYEDYLRYTGQCIAHCSHDSLEKYGATYALALIYFPEELHDKMIKLNDDILSYSWDDALKNLPILLH